MRIKNKYILAAIIVLFPMLSFSQEYSYKIDEEHFSLGFLVEHAGYAKTLGMFRKIEGGFNHDDEKNQISNVKIIVDTSSVFTNHEKRDSHLQSPDFLDIQKFPQMIFTAENIKITKNETTMNGKLTLLGITKDITLKGKINKIAEYPFGFSPPVVMGISARGNFKRSDFGMMYAVEEKLVGDTVELIIEFEAKRN
ncbi:MAG: YceI family protein [Pseudomonadota bacterium]|nr:YceI family protein [Pseudomonadota bacterium]